jgi:hypothetical protein
MKPNYFVVLFVSVLALLLTLPTKVQSFVQIETGKVVQEVLDLELSDGHSLFSINRKYIHGGKNKSLLGSSWCFDFEEEVRREEGGYRLITCGKASETLFKKQKKFYVFENENLEISRDGKIERTTDSEIINYDENGKMTSRAPLSNNNAVVKYFYDNQGKISKITYLDRYEIEFNFDKNDKLASISTKGKRIAAYSVIEENLVSVKNGFGDQFNYDYNDLGYLNHIKYPGDLEEQFSYNKKTKLIDQQITTEGCTRDFDYKVMPRGALDLKLVDSCLKDRPLRVSFSDSVKNKKTKTARKKKPSKQGQVIFVKRDDQKRIYKIEDPKKTWVIKYKDENNKIASIKEITKKTNKAKVYKAKYKNGQIAELSEKGKSKLKFVYSKSGEFLKIKTEKAGKNKSKIASQSSTIAKLELIHAVVGSN